MTESHFRKLALSLPETTEGSHMGHADFRVGGKIFATLPFEGDDDAKDNVPGGVGVLKLTPDQQDEYIEGWPACFEPVNGAWGQRGYTRIVLRAASVGIVKKAMKAAWTNTASKAIAQLLGDTHAQTKPKAQHRTKR